MHRIAVAATIAVRARTAAVQTSEQKQRRKRRAKLLLRMLKEVTAYVNA